MTNYNSRHSDQEWYFNIWIINPTDPRTSNSAWYYNDNYNIIIKIFIN